MLNETFIRRVIIEGVQTEIDGGRFPTKRTVGETVTVLADIFTDGLDVISGALRYRKEESSEWEEVPMKYLLNYRWDASFRTREMGRYVYTLYAWVDLFKSWRSDLIKKVNAKQDVSQNLADGGRPD